MPNRDIVYLRVVIKGKGESANTIALPRIQTAEVLIFEDSFGFYVQKQFFDLIVTWQFARVF
jgi:hypothetical protein